MADNFHAESYFKGIKDAIRVFAIWTADSLDIEDRNSLPHIFDEDEWQEYYWKTVKELKGI